MTRALTYTLWLEEPCLVVAPGGDPNTESTLDYIPGAVVRGALAGAYLRDHSDRLEFTRLFLGGQVRYLNAYPLLGERTLPSLRAWASKKDEGDTVYNRLVETQRNAVEQGIPKAFGRPFARPVPAASETAVDYPEIDYEIAVHTARNRAKGRSVEGDADSALFRYRALARDQAFAGAIVLDDGDSDVERLKKLLGDALTIGGSRTAGYGLVRVEDVMIHDDWREMAGRPQDIAAGNSLVAYLTSHAILYDPLTGRPTTDIRSFLPGHPDDYEIIAGESYAAATWVGGFNTHRGLPLAQQWATQMGSAWRIQATRAVSAAELAAVEHAGIGARREEGFGRVVFDPTWPDQPFTTEKKSLIAARSATGKARPKDEELLAQMNKRLARRELDRQLAAKVNELAPTARGRLSRSQLGRLQVRIRREAGKTNFKDFLDYLEGTTKRKSADDQFRKFTVNGENFRSYLRGLAENSAGVWDLFVDADRQPPRLGQAVYDFRKDAELAHEYTVRFIADLCRQLSKQEVGS